MADYKDIDSKISEKLESFSDVPPSKIWTNIRRDLDKPSTVQRFYQNKNLFWTSIAAVFTGLLIGYFALTESALTEQKYQPRQEQFSLTDPQNNNSRFNKPQKKSGNTFSSNQADAIRTANSNIEKSSIKTKQQKDLANANETKSGVYKKKDTPTSTDQPEQQIITKANDKINNKANLSKLQKQTALVNKSIEKKSTLRRDLNFLLTPTNADIISPDNQQQVLEFSDNISLKLDSLNDYKRSKPYSLGFYINSDYIYNTVDALDGFNQAYGFGLAGQYHLSEQYFFESGLGFYQSKDGWDYIVDYRSKELMGYYQNVDSISYQIVQNSTGQDSVVVQYHTHQEAVYDSVDKTMHDISTKKYTYLSIPLLIGYRNNLNRFYYSLSTGLAFSLEMHEKLEKKELKGSNITVINTRHDYQSRLNTNWHYILNAGIGYQFDHRWSMIVEPGLRVYLKQFYGSSAVIKRPKPYAIRLRAGVFYRF